MATIRQKKAFTILSESIRSSKPATLGQILIGAGYSIETSKKPKLVTERKGWQELLEEAGVTEDKLARVLDEGLEAMAYVKTERVEGVGKGRVKTEEIKTVVDTTTRHRYLETALKVKGLVTNREVPPIQQNNQFNVTQNNFNADPNQPEARELVQKTLDILMEQTKWKPKDVEATPEADVLTSNDKP